jgi:glycine/serine hydroxymethyltransferase
MLIIAELIDRVISNIDNDQVKEQVSNEVKELCKQFVG